MNKHDLLKMIFGTLVIQIHNFAFQHKNYNHFQKHHMFLHAHETKLVSHTHTHFLLFMKKLQFIPHMFGIYFVLNYMLNMFNLTNSQFVTSKFLLVKFYSRNVPLGSIILYIWEAHCNFFWVQFIFEKKLYVKIWALHTQKRIWGRGVLCEGTLIFSTLGL